MISAGLPGDTLFGEMVISADGLSLLGGGWGIRLHRGNDGYADVIATLMSDDVIRIKTRVKYQGAWMPWRELANDYSIINALEKKAPNGFGLGSDPSPFSDANDCIINGWYKDASGQAKNTPWNYSHIFVTTYQSNSYIRQDAYITGGTNSCPLVTHAVRIRHPNFLEENDFWGPWEYESGIPMQLGVEYRTTERYQGKPVYARLVDCGKFPAPGSSKQIAHGISDCYPIRVTGQMSNGNTVPWSEAYNIGADGINIRLYAQTGFSNQSGSNTVALIHYTKTTD